MGRESNPNGDKGIFYNLDKSIFSFEIIVLCCE